MKIDPNLLQQGKIINPKTQHPDEIFAGPAITVSGFAPLPLANGNIRLAFSEQVFSDGKHHFRAAVDMPLSVFDSFIETLIKFKQQISASKPEAPNVGNA